jgi:hypothetical protein
MAMIGGGVAYAQDVSLCPSDAILAKHGFKRDSPPDEHQLKGMVSRALGARARSGINDSAMTSLWGEYCAHPDLQFVKDLLNQLRQLAAEDAGMSLDTEARLHTSMIDSESWDRMRENACKQDGRFIDKFPTDGKKAVVLGIACGGMLSGGVVNLAWSYMDHGWKDALFPAAVVAHCGMRTGTFFGYASYRQCLYEAKKTSAAQVAKALQHLGPSAFESIRFQAAYDKGAKELARLAPQMEALEQKSPDVKASVDRVYRIVDEKYAPLLAKWQPTIDEITKWSHDMNPPADCVERYTNLLSDYVAEQYPGAKGDTLRLAFQDPIGYHLIEAQAACRFKQGDVKYADILRDEFLSSKSPNHRVAGLHDAQWVLLQIGDESHDAKSRGNVAAEAGTAHLIGNRSPDAFWKVKGIGMPGVPRDPKPVMVNGNPYYLTFYSFDDTVSGVEKKGENVLVSFKPHKEKYKYLANCTIDRHHVTWDQWGRPRYKEDCDIKTSEVTVTSEPVLIPAGDAVAVKTGARVAVLKRGTQKPSPAILVWVKKGDDIVWAAGIAAR